MRVDHANGYIEEKNGNKYLVFDTKDENKELQEIYIYVWNGIKNKIKEINVREYGCGKDYMKIKLTTLCMS